MSHCRFANSLIGAVALGALFNTGSTTPADAIGAWIPAHAVEQTMLPFDLEMYRVRFTVGEAEIRVIGDGSSDLDCEVFDSAGSQVASMDTDDTERCVFQWYQWAPGEVRLEIRNMASVFNHYEIIINGCPLPERLRSRLQVQDYETATTTFNDRVQPCDLR